MTGREKFFGDGVGAAERSVLEGLEAAQERMVEAVIDWSAMNTGSANLDGLERMAGILKTSFTALGAEPALLDPASVETVDASGEVRNIRRGRNLHLAVRTQAPVQVLLTGHMDTVFPRDDSFQAAVWREPGVLNGPGVADMKGGLLVALEALKALETSPWAERLGYQVVINSDEEVSSIGSAALLTEAASRAHVGLVYEPATTPEGVLAGARKGLAAFTLVARGVSAHAGRDHAAGRNAVVAAADFAVRAAGLSGARAGLTINVGRIEGGGATNVVPDLAVCRLEARVETHEDRHWIEAELARLATVVGADHRLELELHGRFTRPPKPFDPSTQALFEAVAACGADLGQPISWKPTGGCCDGNNLAETGLPVVDTLGVRGGLIHSRDEFLITASLVERAQLSALLLMRLASGAIPCPPRIGAAA